MMNIAVLIPAYQPDERLIQLVQNLILEKFEIFVIDDGSGSEFQGIFDNVGRNSHCTILHHPINKGKGSALKSGFKEILAHEEILGCVTADSDGQHLVEDIKHIAETLEQFPEEMILGCRDFDQIDVPIKSQLGNKFTRAITQFLIGQKISDTQTGLRGFSKNLMAKMINLPGDRYEFEMNMLLSAKKLNIPIHEVPIHTVYLNENKGSHFDPIKDSFKIYKQIFRFTIVSSLSSIIDLVLFRILYQLLWAFKINESILIATIMARIFSSVFNFFTNRKTVFHNDGNLKKQLIGYYMLAVVIMLLSWWLVAFFNNVLSIDIIWIKLVIDSLLFILSFSVQKQLIFRKN